MINKCVFVPVREKQQAHVISSTHHDGVRLRRPLTLQKGTATREREPSRWKELRRETPLKSEFLYFLPFSQVASNRKSGSIFFTVTTWRVVHALQNGKGLVSLKLKAETSRPFLESKYYLSVCFLLIMGQEATT